MTGPHDSESKDPYFWIMEGGMASHMPPAPDHCRLRHNPGAELAAVRPFDRWTARVVVGVTR